MSTLDLNKRRAARREAAGESLTVRIGDDAFELPSELPLDLAEHMQALTDGNVAVITSVVESLFGKDTEKFMSYRPSLEDLGEIIEAYGTSLGELQASTSSSPNGGTSSRPTSSDSTE